MEHEARPVGFFAGQTWQYYELRAHYPEAWDAIWNAGSFHVSGLGPENRILAGQRSRGDAPAALLLDGHAAHIFLAGVRIALASAEVRAAPYAYHRSASPDELLEGFSGFDTQVAHDYGVDLDGAPVGLRYTDHFLGIRQGRPVWEFHLWATGLQPHMLPTGGGWEVPGLDPVSMKNLGDVSLGLPGVKVQASGGFEAVLDQVTYDHAPPGRLCPRP